MLKCLLMLMIFASADIALAQENSDKIEQIDFIDINASLNVFTREQALEIWNNRNPSNFLTNSEIARVSFAAFREARRSNIDDPSRVSRAVGGMIYSYQNDNFEVWRAKVGQLYLLRDDGLDQDGFGDSILNFIGALDFGGIAQIIAQIVAIIQLFL